MTTANACRPAAGWRFLWLATAVCAAAPGHALERHYTAVAYDADSSRIRYREEHWLFDEHGVQTRLVLYRCPGGQPFARKTMHYADTPWTPDFDMVDHRDGYAEGVRRVQDQWQVYVQRNAQSPRETASLPNHPDTVIDAGFDDYVQSHWVQLSGQRPLAAAFLMPGRLAYLNVRLQSVERTTHDGIAQQHFRMSLDSWLGAIAPNVMLTYAEADRRLLEFVGPSNVRDAHGKHKRVRIEFSDHDAAPASPAQIQVAANEPLVDHCPDG